MKKNLTIVVGIILLRASTACAAQLKNTIIAGTATITGSAFSVGGSTLVVSGGVIKAGVNAGTYVQDPAFLSSRLVSDASGSGHAHAFSDNSNISRTGMDSYGYNSFDSLATFIGTGNIEHFVGFQNRPSYIKSGTLSYLYGYYDSPSMSGAGTVINRYGIKILDVNRTGSGVLTNQYGIFIAPLSTASVNYGIYSDGVQDTYLGGDLGIGAGIPDNRLVIKGTDARFNVETGTGVDVLIGGDDAGNGGFLNFNNTSGATKVHINGYTNGSSYFNGGNVGIGTTAPGAKLDVSSGVINNAGAGAGITTTGNVTASAFSGPLTGAASLNVLKSGDTMTGPLTLSGSSLTVTAKGFEVNGGNSIYVNPTTGNVGIGGVFAPAYPFVVKSSRINLHQTNDASYVYMRHADTTGNSATLTLGAAYGNWVDSDGLSIYNGNTTALKNLTVAGSAFSVGGSTLVVSGGKVGIGIAAPLAILHSYSPAVGAPSLSDDVNTSQLFETGAQGAFALGQYAASPYAMWLQGKGLNVSTSYPLSIQPLGGNVGIGTTAPGAKLDVSSGVINNAGAGAGITTTGNITAAFIYGNGSGLTGLPGGGDAILASTQTFTGINTFVSSASFSGVTSTVTFYGWIDIGLEIMTDGGTAENDSVSCSGGKRVIGGGCYTTSAVYTSYPETSVKWTCRTAVAQPIEAYAICARVK